MGKTPAVVVGALLGGAAAGFLWTAQGGYFTTICLTYAKVTGEDEKSVTNTLASRFAAIYLLGELLMKGLATILKSSSAGKNSLFVVYSIVAVVAATGMTFVKDFEAVLKAESPDAGMSPTEEKKRKELTLDMFLNKAQSAGRLLLSDPRMIMLYPAQIIFGFMGSFLNSYANKYVVKDVLGDGNDKWVGLMTAIVAAVAALCAFLLGHWPCNTFRKRDLLALGGVIYIIEVLLFVLKSDRDLGAWGWCILI